MKILYICICGFEGTEPDWSDSSESRQERYAGERLPTKHFPCCPECGKAIKIFEGVPRIGELA